jgi:hypothetical protein
VVFETDTETVAESEVQAAGVRSGFALQLFSRAEKSHASPKRASLLEGVARGRSLPRGARCDRIAFSDPIHIAKTSGAVFHSTCFEGANGVKRRVAFVTLGVVLWGGACLGLSRNARGEEPLLSPEKNLSVYVSAKFKKVAKRIVRQLAVRALEDACPKGKPLCTPLVEAIGGAFDAALDGDFIELRTSVSGLFVHSATVALLSYATGEMTRIELTPDQKKVVDALVCSLSQVLMGKRVKRACLDASLVRSLETVGLPEDTREVVDRVAKAVQADEIPAAKDIAFAKSAFLWSDVKGVAQAKACLDDAGRTQTIRAVCRTLVPAVLENRVVARTLGESGLRALRRVTEALHAGDSPSAVDLVTLLAAVANQAGRPELASHVAAVLPLFRHGLEGGFYPAALATLREEPQFALASTLASGGHAFLKYAAAEDTAYLQAIEAAKRVAPAGRQDRYDAWKQRYQAWAAARDAFKARLAIEIPRRNAVETAGLLAVLEAARAIGALPEGLAGAERDLLLETNRQLGYLVGALAVQNTLNRYGLAFLAAAAILDFARTGSDTELEANIKLTLIYGVGQLALRALAIAEAAETNTPGKVTYRRLDEADGLCEVKALKVLLGLLPDGAVAGGTCVSAVNGDAAAVVTIPGPSPDERLGFVTDRLRELVVVLRKESAGLGAAEAEARAAKSGIPLEPLRRALLFYAQGKSRAGRKAMARLGIDLVVTRLHPVLSEVLEVSPEACLRQTGVTSIFCGPSARCTAHILLEGAYDAVADYLWDVGGHAEADVAKTVYKNLLGSKSLDSLPLVLNVGLGINHVWLRDNERFAALTLLDKIGVAFLKTFSRDTVFELGVFAGGFLDALIRTAADEGEDQRYWLAGASLGFTRIRGLDVGIEAHVAAAMPFSLERGWTQEVGLTVGGAIVVPFTLVFDDDD